MIELFIYKARMSLCFYALNMEDNGCVLICLLIKLVEGLFLVVMGRAFQYFGPVIQKALSLARGG